MPWTKRIADWITWGRAGLGLCLVWLAWIPPERSLPWAVWCMVIDWSGDLADGALARRAGRAGATWIGAHELFVDMFVATGLLVYLAGTGFIPGLWAVLYLGVWAGIFWWAGVPKALGELYQAPVYGWFIWVAWAHAPRIGWVLPLWIGLAVAITWPRFPKQVVPEFLQGMAQVGRQIRTEVFGGNHQG